MKKIIKIKRKDLFKIHIIDSLGKLFNLQEFLNDKLIFEKNEKKIKTQNQMNTKNSKLNLNLLKK